MNVNFCSHRTLTTSSCQVGRKKSRADQGVGSDESHMACFICINSKHGSFTGHKTDDLSVFIKKKKKAALDDKLVLKLE